MIAIKPDGSVAIAGAALAYLGTPYSLYPDHLGGLDGAAHEAARIAGALLARGIYALSPIAHGHAVACSADLDPRDYGIWVPYNIRLMRRCDVLIVAQMEGWQTSVGLFDEVAWFGREKKPVVYCDPASLALRAAPFPPAERAVA